MIFQRCKWFFSAKNSKKWFFVAVNHLLKIISKWKSFPKKSFRIGNHFQTKPNFGKENHFGNNEVLIISKTSCIGNHFRRNVNFVFLHKINTFFYHHDQILNIFLIITIVCSLKNFFKKFLLGIDRIDHSEQLFHWNFCSKCVPTCLTSVRIFNHKTYFY